MLASLLQTRLSPQMLLFAECKHSLTEVVCQLKLDFRTCLQNMVHSNRRLCCTHCRC